MTDKEYNHLVELRNNCYRDRRNRETEINYFTGFNDGYEKGKESLAEENAELKETVTKMNNVIIETFSKLTKAKEIIRDLLSCLYSVEYDRISDLEEAEQFLNKNSTYERIQKAKYNYTN